MVQSIARLSLALALLGAPAAASAQSILRSRATHTRPIDLSILGVVPFPAGVGGGIRVGFPIVPNGFIPSLNDGVFLEPGAQVVYWTDFDADAAGFEVPILMRWDFYLTRAWTVFGSVGFLFGYFPDERDRLKVRGDNIFTPGRRGFFHVVFGGGAMFNFNDRVSLRLDASTQMLAVGVALRFR